MVLATTCTMYPGRRLGPRRGGHHQEGGASSSSRPTGGYGDRGGDDPTRRSRTTSRDRGQPAEDVVATLHRRLALMFATVLEGNYTPREAVTPYGVKQTLRHLLGAARSLDDGYYFVIKDALGYCDGPEEYKAKELLNDAVKRVEDRHGPLPEENGDLSRLLLQRYHELLRNIGYPVLRLEEMVYGPTLGPETLQEEANPHTPLKYLSMRPLHGVAIGQLETQKKEEKTLETVENEVKVLKTDQALPKRKPQRGKQSWNVAIATSL